MVNKIGDDFNFNLGANSVAFRDIGPRMKEIAAAYGFCYTSTIEGSAKTITLSTILSLITAYRSRFAEVRMGNGSIAYKNYAEEVKEIQIQRFGLDNRHYITLTGCTYTPTMQSSMKTLLGPMTIAINLAMTDTDSQYQKGWIAAFIQAFKLIPFADLIAHEIKGSKQNKIGFIKELADLCLFGISKASNKAHIPMAMIMAAMETDKVSKGRYKNGADKAEALVGYNLVNNLDFSSKLVFFCDKL